ncbi:MAG TPA: flagella basal body P-ring formation protein FlgA [Sphingomonas sp.]|uniref:flagella basal body P-ring formation protein FlgA n=1 Tax=Sphingomonas sp. TaxID=28214 RepID=UPI002BB2E2BC|nr:flagella basal body P-ring formation protein FlgA [Sphingomonas sp.]HMI18011.1 flagella basal body P-ring formation protein FlgA [Sphingomonas sp.]
MYIRALPLLALLAAPAAAVTPFQNIDALETRLIAALGAGIGQPGGPATAIDRRLKLATCPASVQIDPPAMGAVALRCPAANWRIRVPISRLGGAQGAQTVGMGGFSKADMVVRRGDPVDLIAETNGFSVSVAATAQEDGAPGSRIRVKAEGQKVPIFAEVIEAGRVKLPGFK